MEATVIVIVAEKVGSKPSPATKDNAKIRSGLTGSRFPPVCAEPANLADSGRMRVGAMSPAFPPVRTR